MSEKKLNELKEKVAELQEEIRKLTPEELEQVFGGCGESEIHISSPGSLVYSPGSIVSPGSLVYSPGSIVSPGYQNQTFAG